MSKPARKAGPFSLQPQLLAPIAWSSLAGILLAASLPPLSLWPAGPIGAGLLYLGLRDRSVIRRAAFGFCCGLWQFGIGLWFIAQFTGLGYLFAIVIEALFLGLGCALVTERAWRPASFVASLTLAEWARDSWPFGGVPLGSIVLGQAGSPLASLARVSGTALLCAGIYLLGALLAEIALVGKARLTGREHPGTERGESSARALLVGLGLALALFALAPFAPNGGGATSYVRAVAVQGGGPRGLNQIEVPTIDALERTVEESAQLSGKDRLVLWPEDVVALGATLGAVPSQVVLGELARSLKAVLVVGATKPEPKARFLNEVLEVSPSGKILGRVEKVHPVPFGEYVPFRGLFRHLVNLNNLPLDAIAGKAPELLHSPFGLLGVLISYESFFPGLARTEVAAGAKVLLLPTNTASYQTSQVPAQELASSRLIAIATGRDLLQAATVGYSAFVEPNGAVISQSALGDAQLVTAHLALRSGQSLYDRFGELPVLVLAALSLGASWLFSSRRRLEQKQP